MDARKIDTSNLMFSSGRDYSVASAAAVKLGEPMKVFLAAPQSTDYVEGERVAKIVKHESLVEESEQLPRENSALRQLFDGAALLDETRDWSGMCRGYQWTTPWSAPITQAGDLVYLHGLQTDTDLNSRYGTVMKWDDTSGRWLVWLSATKQTLMKPENLVVVRQQLTCNAEWYPHVDEATMYSHSHRAGSAKRARRKNSLRSNDSESTAASTASEHSGELTDGAGFTSVTMQNCPKISFGHMLLDLFDEQGTVVDTFGVRMSSEDSNVEFASADDAERFQAHFKPSSATNIVRANLRREPSSCKKRVTET